MVDSLIGVKMIVNHRIKNMSFLCAILVVAMHVMMMVAQGRLGCWELLTKSGVCRIAVPYFFGVSGYMILKHREENNWYWRALLTRLKTLLIPYVCWIIIFYMFGLLCAWLNGVAGIYVAKLDGYEFLRIIGLSTDIPAYNPMWYLRMLMVLAFLSCVLEWLIDRCGVAIVAFFFVSYMGVMTRFGNGEGVGKFFEYTFSLEGLFYFAMGMYIRLRGTVIKREKSVALICLGGAALMFLLDSRFVGRIAIPLALYGVWTFVPSRPWPSWLVKCAFSIYLMHIMLAISIRYLLCRMGGINAAPILECVLVTMTTICLCVALTNLLAKLSPLCCRLLFGGRLD